MTDSILRSLLILAQADGPARPGATPAAAAPAAGTAAGAEAVPAQPGGGGFMIMMMVLLGTMILFTFVSGRREKKKRAELLGSIKKHDKVMTIGGVMGTVVELKDDSVVLKVDETSNTRITFSKTAISQVIAQDSAA
ncbi:MAG: preprotein translocase subunit YajC [Phycisphaerales bacterium]